MMDLYDNEFRRAADALHRPIPPLGASPWIRLIGVDGSINTDLPDDKLIAVEFALTAFGAMMNFSVDPAVVLHEIREELRRRGLLD